MSEEIFFYEAYEQDAEYTYQPLMDLLSEAFKYKEIPSKEIFWGLLYQRRLQNVYTIVMQLNQKIIGTASIIIEIKLNGKIAAHIEDVAINKELRGFGYGKRLMDYVKKFCEEEGCYRITLFCNNPNIAFYKKCGYRHACNLMRMDLS